MYYLEQLLHGLSGDFYITIDPSGTDVAVKYTITLDLTSLSNQNLSISSVSEINYNASLTVSDDQIVGIIPLANVQNNNVHRIKVSVQWENNEAYNNEDTELGIAANQNIAIPVTVDVIQYLGE